MFVSATWWLLLDWPGVYDRVLRDSRWLGDWNGFMAERAIYGNAQSTGVSSTTSLVVSAWQTRALVPRPPAG